MRLFSDSRPFYRANFHCHTTESDGRLDPDSAVRFYGDSGYDILSILNPGECGLNKTIAIHAA